MVLSCTIVNGFEYVYGAYGETVGAIVSIGRVLSLRFSLAALPSSMFGFSLGSGAICRRWP
jgi:hypothetical protein